MNVIINDIKEICNRFKLPQRHTDFQIENFIIGKETSICGQMWQCIRELQNRLDILESIDLELIDAKENMELAEIDLDKLQLKNKKEDFADCDKTVLLKKRKKEILILKQKRKIDSYERSITRTKSKKEDVQAESETLLNIFRRLINEHSFVDINDPAAQLEFWNSKFGTDLNLTAMLNHPLNSELVKSVLALPKESTVKIQLQKALESISNKLITQKS